jgi:hypothetical protein
MNCSLLPIVHRDIEYTTYQQYQVGKGWVGSVVRLADAMSGDKRLCVYPQADLLGYHLALKHCQSAKDIAFEYFFIAVQDF